MGLWMEDVIHKRVARCLMKYGSLGKFHKKARRMQCT